jgi:acetyltransferase-like isoleucine patch superfamily enzyme
MATTISFMAAITSVAGHDWYTVLKAEDGNSCCSMKDCHPVGHRYNGIIGLEIQIGEAWFVVNPASVLPVSSPDNNAHACYYYGSPRNIDKESKNYLNWYVVGPIIRCVILPSNS